MTEHGGGIVRDTLLGDIQVYREFIPKEDAIEYTVFFRHRGDKYRMDFKLKSEAFNGEMTQGHLEGYIMGRIHERYERHDYVLATEYVKDKQGYAI